MGQLAIGDPYQGGIVAHLGRSGQHSLIAATHDLDGGTGIRWYKGEYTVTGATARALGTGASNTAKIIASQGSPATSYAAGLAAACTDGGFNDWHLPSLDELDKLFLNQDAIGGFAPANYWSSSERDECTAWYQHFRVGAQHGDFKYEQYRVRAVRRF